MSRILVLTVFAAVALLAGGASATLRSVEGASSTVDYDALDAAATQKIVNSLQQDVHNHWNFLHPNSGTMLADENGGGGCAACTLLIGLLEQVAQIKNATIDKTIGDFCGHIDPHIAQGCKDFFNQYGAAIIKLVENDFTGDEVCNGIHICKDTDGKKCRLFPPSHLRLNMQEITRELHMKTIKAEVRASLLRTENMDINPQTGLAKFNICTILPGICPVENHLPQTDVDGDRFSPKGSKTMRGTYWRGVDCNDNDNTIHPGAASDSVTGGDMNCNGIHGVDPTDGITYEQKYCAGTNASGTAILGDSATAHFAIPPQWLTAKDVAKSGFKSYDNLLLVAEDEMDWPMLSWSTGHLNSTEFKDNSGPVESVYLQAKENNLCNNNDYQNLGVNGARSGKLKPFAELLGRASASNPAANKPMQLWMAMIGNDVCNGHHTFRTMTPVAQYKAAVKEAVLYADTILAPGSSIVLMGLADGRVLWDTMYDRIHPIGSTNNDVTYKDIYDYLNCLHLNPCWGWLNSNATIRNMTSAHAELLSATLPEIVAETQPILNNIKIVAVLDWINAIKEAPMPHWELIEPVDGFHPSQLGNALIAEYMNNQTKMLGVAPAVNPNNAAIKMRFGL